MSPILVTAAVLLPLAAAFAKPTGKGRKPAGKSGDARTLTKLWDERDTPGNAEKLIAECEKILAAEAGNYDAHWRIARTCWWIADRSPDGAVKKEFGQRGYEHGEQAVALNPNGVEGYTWYAAALGEYGLGISIVKALFQGLDGKFRKYCQQAIEIDPAHDGAAPLRAMGRFYAKLPFPKQDLRRSRELLEEAIKLAPERFLSRLYLAETLVALGRPEEALPQLEWVLKSKASPDERADRARYVEQALEICQGVPGGDALARKYRK